MTTYSRNPGGNPERPSHQNRSHPNRQQNVSNNDQLNQNSRQARNNDHYRSRPLAAPMQEGDEGNGEWESSARSNDL